MEGMAIVILAAGKGTRMNSDLVKVLHPLMGIPMLSYTLDLSLNGIHAEKTVVVVGYQADRIRKTFNDPRLQFALQKDQLGTGHAVMEALPFLQDFNGTVLILCGDVPLVKLETLRSFIDAFRRSGSTLSVLTTVVDNPFGYGRVLRNTGGWLEKIVEEKDASEEERLTGDQHRHFQ
jgi:bifunctional UDP-N-acetylglucosamine pyrophosphorylase/glucosamine-1-phosphate N-acetyltransferase